MPAADKHVLDLKSELEAIENLPLETNRERKQTNNVKRSLTKRQAEEEGRGWKNKDKKNKKDKKKNKKDKKRKKLKLDELELPTEAHEEEEVIKEVVDEGETESGESAAEAPFTSGLQFSAYSRQSQPSYEEPHQQKFLYGLDSQGNAQYMDSEAVAEVLQTPQAMKAMMAYLSTAEERREEDSAIPSRLQEHFRPPAPRRPLWHLVGGGQGSRTNEPCTGRPASTGGTGEATPAREAAPCPETSSGEAWPQEAVPRTSKNAVLWSWGLCARAGSPCPGKWLVPARAAVDHHGQGGVVRLQAGGQASQDVYPRHNDQPALKLEPKPR